MAFRAIVSAIIVVMALALGVALLDVQEDRGADREQRLQADGVRLADTDTFVPLNTGKGTNQTVFKTTGYAVNLTGSGNSFVSSNAEFNISRDNSWSVSIWAHVDQDASSDTMSVVSLDGQAIISYNGQSNQWEGWYYSESSTHSYQVNVSTSGTDVGSFTHLVLQSDGQTLSIYRNTTAGESKSLTSESLTPAPVNATNWDGRLEELRTFDETLNTSQRQTLFDNPVQQQPAWNTTSRAMFDEYTNDRQLLFYTDTTLRQSNVRFSNGFAQINATNVTDYEWNTDGPQIRPRSGGNLEGAPGAYADYTYVETKLDPLLDGYQQFAVIGALLPLLLITMVILSVMRGA